MVGLLGGEAEPLPQAAWPQAVAQQAAPEPAEQDEAAAQTELAPMVLDGVAPAYVANPRYSQTLSSEARGERPQRPSQFLRGAMYGLTTIYRTAGVDNYDWQRK